MAPLLYASNQTPPRGILANVELQTESAMASAVRMKNLKPLVIAPDQISRSATVYAVSATE